MSTFGTTAIRARNALRSAWTELRHPGEKRIPILDGLRTIAILLVVNHHVCGAWDDRFGSNRYTSLPFVTNGWVGVDLFFVLSGFFIGSQLWRELVRTGTISWKDFMLRRSLRIWPLYFFVYAAVVILYPQFAASKHYGWTDVVFLVNYLGGGVVLGGWSLSTEEQFYLVAPVLLLLFQGRSLRWFRWMLGGLWVLEIAVRTAEYVHAAGAWHVKNAAAFEHVYYPFHTHSDGLIAGMIVSNLVVAARQPHAAQMRGLLARPWVLLLLSVVAMGVCWKLQSETLNFAGLGLLFGAAVWWGIHRFPQAMAGQAFYVGSRLSFGMYLNHQYLIEPVTRVVVRGGGHGHAPLWAAPAIVVGVLCLSALLSAATFCVVEHPFLLLRTVLLRRRSAVPLVAH